MQLLSIILHAAFQELREVSRGEKDSSQLATALKALKKTKRVQFILAITIFQSIT